MIRLLAGLCLLLVALCGRAEAHDLRPAYLALTEREPGIYAVHWKAPAMGDSRLAVYPQLPASAIEVVAHEAAIMNDAYVERWTVKTPNAFAGETIVMDGLAEVRTDVLLRIERLDGEIITARLTPAAPSYLVPAETGWRQVATTYIGLGVEHILYGVDHLLFVAALMLLVRDLWTLFKTITAFTIAHSITLTLATIGWVTLPGPVVEALVALSILFVATEIIRQRSGATGLSISSPWIVAFAFGLLHGFGFAGALVELGLPRGDIPLALLTFNIGVEAGQLAFIAAILVAFHAARRVFEIPRLAAPACAYVIGPLAAFWVFERLDLIFL